MAWATATCSSGGLGALEIVEHPQGKHECACTANGDSANKEAFSPDWAWRKASQVHTLQKGRENGTSWQGTFEYSDRVSTAR